MTASLAAHGPPTMSSRNRVSSAPVIRVRVARFEDVPDILRLLERAIERGCRRHYTARERRGVFASYALRAFLDVVGPFETFVVEGDGGRLSAFAQLDSSTGWLRALFVDGEWQEMVTFGYFFDVPLSGATFQGAGLYRSFVPRGAIYLTTVGYGTPVFAWP